MAEEIAKATPSHPAENQSSIFLPKGLVDEVQQSFREFSPAQFRYSTADNTTASRELSNTYLGVCC